MKVGIDYVGVGVGALIVNEKHEVLLMKRSQQCKNKRGWWAIPGGTVEFNETFHTAIQREVREELGIEIEILFLLSLTDDIMPEEKQHWVTPQFLCNIVGGTLENKEPHKCEALQWFSLDTLPSPLTLPAENAITAYRKK